jgi:cysteine-S-conjugate beta-lyase
MGSTQALQTSLVHSSYEPPEGFVAIQPPVHRASTVLFKNVADMRTKEQDWSERSSYIYGLKGTPTTYELEARLAAIEGGRHCMLTPSGLGAIAMVDLALLGSGDEVLIPDNVYGPSRELGRWLKEKFNIDSKIYDPMIGSDILKLIQSNTRLIWIETPGSVSMEVPDVQAISRAAHERGVLVAIDNTWSAGLAFHPFDHGVDISIQAVTKYQSGGSDVLMGAVITNDRELIRRLSQSHLHLGFGVTPETAAIVLRSLPTLKIRFQAHDAGALRVATWLNTRNEISKVLHPALPNCPGHEFWKRDFSGSGGLFSVLFDPRFSEIQIDRFIDGLHYFKIGYSWGGAESLCLPYRMQEMRNCWNEQGFLVRFNIGLEDPEDLISDIAQSLEEAFL